jgi:hypothetical protein
VRDTTEMYTTDSQCGFNFGFGLLSSGLWCHAVLFHLQDTLYHNPEDLIPYFHLLDNLKSDFNFSFYWSSKYTNLHEVQIVPYLFSEKQLIIQKLCL